jgi:iron complex transport system ATP-binding protein
VARCQPVLNWSTRLWCPQLRRAGSVVALVKGSRRVSLRSVTEVIRTDAATVFYGDRAVLDHLSWVVRDGERWVVLGPNGAGKTTLLDLISTASHPTDGDISILGEQLGLTDVFGLRPLIGVVSNATTSRIPKKEKVRDAIVTAGWAITGRWRETYDVMDMERADDLMSIMGIEEIADRQFGTLSEGERKRTLIARALMPDPELLLLDEPATGLDLGSRESLVNRLSVLAKDPTAPVQVMITHHVEEIPPGFSHALLLRDGKVIAQGRIDSVITDENLSQTFGLPLSVRKVFSRFWAFAI